VHPKDAEAGAILPHFEKKGIHAYTGKCNAYIFFFLRPTTTTKNILQQCSKKHSREIADLACEIGAPADVVKLLRTLKIS
jgi:hypothetical protein